MASKDVKFIIDVVDQASSKLDDIGKNTEKLAGSWKEMGLAVGAAMTAIGAAVTSAGLAFANEAGEFEQYRKSLNTLTGDIEVAGKLFEELKDFAKETPFSFEDVVKGTKQLLAMGATVEDVIPEMKMLGDVSAGLGVPMERLILNFGQVRTQGKLTGRELRDFSVAGVDVLGALANQINKSGGVLRTFGGTSAATQKKIDSTTLSLQKQQNRFDELKKSGKEGTATFKNLELSMEANRAKLQEMGPVQESYTQRVKVTKEELADMVSEGEISFDMVKQAFIDMTSEGGKFNDMMITQSNTFLGKQEKMSDAMQQLRVALGEALVPALVQVVDAITPLIEQFTVMAQNNPELIEIIFLMGAAFLAIGTALLFVIPLVIAFQLGMLPIIGTIGLIIAIIAVLVGAIIYLALNFETLKKNVLEIFRQLKIRWDETVDSMTKKMTELKTQFDLKIESIRSTVESWKNLITGYFESIRLKIQSVIDTISDLWNKIKNAPAAVLGQLGIEFKQHGGVIPGSYNQAVPAILHGGERVIPKTGVDVNGGGGGGGTTINLIIEGDVNSVDMVEHIVDRVREAFGRDNELESYGVSR